MQWLNIDHVTELTLHAQACHCIVIAWLCCVTPSTLCHIPASTTGREGGGSLPCPSLGQKGSSCFRSSYFPTDIPSHLIGQYWVRWPPQLKEIWKKKFLSDFQFLIMLTLQKEKEKERLLSRNNIGGEKNPRR